MFALNNALRGMTPAKLSALTSMVTKYGQLGSGDLTEDILRDVIQSFGFNPALVTSEKFGETLALLKEADIDKLADLVGQPDTLARVLSTFKPQDPPRDVLFVCDDCGAMKLYTVKE